MAEKQKKDEAKANRDKARLMQDVDDSEDERKRASGGLDLPAAATSVVKKETEKIADQKASNED